jgi:hypothetical protein
MLDLEDLRVIADWRARPGVMRAGLSGQVG